MLILNKRIGIHKEKIKKTYDLPKTPYQRILESNTVCRKEKEKLKKVYATLNPVELKRNIDKKLKKI